MRKSLLRFLLRQTIQIKQLRDKIITFQLQLANGLIVNESYILI